MKNIKISNILLGVTFGLCLLNFYFLFFLADLIETNSSAMLFGFKMNEISFYHILNIIH